MIKVPLHSKFVWDKNDGGRHDAAKAFYGKSNVNDCGPRAVAIATGKNYALVHHALDTYKKELYADRGARRCTNCDHGTPFKAVEKYLKYCGSDWKYVDLTNKNIRTGSDSLPIYQSMIFYETNHLIAVDCHIEEREYYPKIVYTYHDSWDSTKSKRKLHGFWYNTKLGYVDNVDALAKSNIEVHNPDDIPYFTLM